MPKGEKIDILPQDSEQVKKYKTQYNKAVEAGNQKIIDKLYPFLATQSNVAKGSAATQAPLNSDRDVSMASQDPDIQKIAVADKKRDEEKIKDKNNPRNQAAVLRAEADVLDANTDAQKSLQQTPKKADVAKPKGAAPQKSEAEILHDKLINRQLSDEDLKRIWELYQKGEWKWGFGTSTTAELQRLGLLDPKPTDATTAKQNTEQKVEQKAEAKPAWWSDAGYLKWRDKEAVLYYKLKGQLRRANEGIDEEELKSKTNELMQDMYNQKAGSSKYSLRDLQAKYKISDISDDYRSDRSVARSIRKAWKKTPTGEYVPKYVTE